MRPNFRFSRAIGLKLLIVLLSFLASGAAMAAAAPAADGAEVRVPNFVFDPVRDGEPMLRAGERFDGQQAGLRLVQLQGPTEDTWLEEMKAAGLRVLQYYPHHTYLVWGPEPALRATESLGFVRWTGNFHPAYKINRDLTGRTGRVHNVDVFFYNDGDIKTTLTNLQALGAKVIQAYPAQPDEAFYVAVVELNAAAVDAVSRLGTVLWLGYSHPVPVLEDEMSSQILAGNYSGAGVPFTGYLAHLGTLGFDGSGVRWAIIDDGVYYDHPDFAGRIVAGYDFPGGCSTPGKPGNDCAGSGHGTHVTGIVGATAAGGFGDANGFKYGLGVAPGYGIVALNSLSASAWPPAGGWQEHSKQALALNAIGGNNSWTTGEGLNHGYQASERTHDLIVLDGSFDTPGVIEPFIEVFSAGNSGPGGATLTAPKEAKNLIVVASSENYRAGNINTISSFSSRGPAVDGRIVPTIAAPGGQIASTRSSNSPSACQAAIGGTSNLYSFCSGTSMASPHVSGAVVLASQWWRGFNAGADPSPAMAKALLVNSATPMGTIPNNNEGWGRVNTTDLIVPEVHTIYYDQTHILANSGEQWNLSFGVVDPGKPLKITLAWSDAPGAVGANPALVNNLDLIVLNGATTYRGNVFSGGWSATGGTADALNNLENVYIQNPGSDATITVKATNIAGDGVPGNGDSTDQNFALVCQNCVLAPDYTLSATPTSASVCAPTAASFTVNVGSILGYNSPVTLGITGSPAGTTTNFSANPVTPVGVSTLTIGNTGAAAAGSYTLSLSGSSVSGNKSVDLGLNLFNAAPVATTLASPANGAANVPAVPTFSWNAPAQAATYSIQVASDAGFSNVVASASGLSGTSWTSTVTLNTSSTYYWRVWADNICGVGAYSATASFTTVAAPGDCGPGTSPNVLQTTTFESGLGGWAQGSGSTGTNTWAISSTNPHAGTQHVHATNPAALSDQRLVSPAVTLPSGENPVVLKFWHVPNMENSGAAACYDGGILEVSSNGGTSWTQVANSSLLVGGYRGAISSSFSNPLAGLQAWCGGTSYMQTIADVSAYAGQSVQFRYRLGSDSSVGKPGWDLDDVTVQSCAASAPNIAVSPASLSSTQGPNVSSSQTLTIGNTGAADLTWAVGEEPGNGGTCSSPSDVPWLSVTPTGGTTAGAASTPLTVTLDSTGLLGGTYNASLCVTSDDPDAGPGNGTALVVVPVTLQVDAISIFRDGFED